MDLDRLNTLPDDEARRALRECCASATWADRMAGRRPFSSTDDLLAAAREEWQGLGPSDREEAFAAHPRIGDRITGDGQHAAWSRREQSTAGDPGAGTLARLADCNREYETRFDRVFLVFATGKSADEMLALCEERLGNDPETEYQIASDEQEKITNLRLQRLIGIG